MSDVNDVNKIIIAVDKWLSHVPNQWQRKFREFSDSPTGGMLVNSHKSLCSEARCRSLDDLSAEGWVAGFVFIAGVLTNWFRWKTVYSFDKSFFDALVDTDMENMTFNLESMRNLPSCGFLIVPPDSFSKNCVGLFVYIEMKAEMGFCVVCIRENEQYEYGWECYSLPLCDGDNVKEKLDSWLDVSYGGKHPDDDFDDVYEVMQAVIQVAYYLSAQNCIKKESKTPKVKRPRLKNGHVLNLKRWEVGYRIGCDYSSASKRESSVNIDSQSDIKSDATDVDVSKIMHRRGPHVRRGHWHHHWVGSGDDKRLLPYWHEPTYVNGGENDIIPTEHKVR